MDIKILRIQGFRLSIGLAIQYLLGTWINFYVSFPEEGSAKEMWEFAKTQPIVLIHILWGILLIIGSASLLFRSFKMKESKWIKCAGFSLIAIIIAWFSGERFVSTQSDIYSFTMALGLIGAIISYSWGLF